MKEYLIEQFPHMEGLIGEVYERSIETGEVELYGFFGYPSDFHSEGTIWFNNSHPEGAVAEDNWQYYVASIPGVEYSSQTVFNQAVRDGAIFLTLQAEAAKRDNYRVSDPLDRTGTFGIGIAVEVEDPLFITQIDLDYAAEIAQMANTLTKGYTNNGFV